MNGLAGRQAARIIDPAGAIRPRLTSLYEPIAPTDDGLGLSGGMGESAPQDTEPPGDQAAALPVPVGTAVQGPEAVPAHGPQAPPPSTQRRVPLRASTPAASSAALGEPPAEDRGATPVSRLIAPRSDSRAVAPASAPVGRARARRPGSAAAEETAPREARTAAAAGTAPTPAAVLPVRADGGANVAQTAVKRRTDQLPTGRDQQFPDDRAAGSPATGPQPNGPTPPVAPPAVRTSAPSPARDVGRTAAPSPAVAADLRRLASDGDTRPAAPAPPTEAAQAVARAVHPTVTLVPATAAPAPGPRPESPAPEPQEPVINVTIDHVEVRTPAPPAPAPPPAAHRPGPPVMTMDDYLNRRRGRGGQ